jgi:hypothetical protein
MKKRILLLILISILGTNLIFADELIDNKYNCTQGLCVPGYNIEITTTIYNNGEREIGLKKIEYFDNSANQTFDSIDFEDYIEIPTDEQKNFTSKTVLPKTQKENIFEYRICLTQKVPTSAWGKVGKNTRFCYPEVYKVPFEDCFIDDDCNTDQQCIANSCKRLDCGYCQSAYNHTCNDLECCKDEECPLDRSCNSNICLQPVCGDNEYIINHSCGTCPDNQTLINYSCQYLECKEDEYIENKTCIRLNCTWNQTTLNHSCIDLNCSLDQQISNHSCIKARCKDDEELVSHRCVTLECGFLTKAEQNECLIDSDLIIEVLLIITIMTIAALILKKYRLSQRKKTLDVLWDKAKNRKNKNPEVKGDKK